MQQQRRVLSSLLSSRTFVIRRQHNFGGLRFQSTSSGAVSSSEYSPSMEQIKNLRSISSAPIKDCKAALVESAGEMSDALEFLRKKGISTANKKSGRSTKEGLVAVSLTSTCASIVEVNSETDFVARNEKFQSFVNDVATKVLESDTKNDDNLNDVVSQDSVSSLTGVLGEKIALGRFGTLRNHQSVVGYVHNKASLNMGQAAAIVALDTSKELTLEQQEIVQQFGKKLAMHIVATKPTYVSTSDIPSEIVEKERAFLTEEALASGKPPAIVSKMVEGRLKKSFSDYVLLEQDHVAEEGNPKISSVLSALKIPSLSIAGFKRFQVGE